MNDNNVAYYTEFTDSNGHRHYAIHKYNRLTGFITSMRDYRFDDRPIKKVA